MLFAKMEIELIDGNLCFDGRVLVKQLPADAVAGLTDLIEESKVTPRIRLRSPSIRDCERRDGELQSRRVGI